MPGISRDPQRLKHLLEKPEVESWRALMAAFQAVFHELERALLAESCSISRFQILLHLYFNGPMSAADIARKLYVTRGNVSTFLRRLEADGLARPQKSADKGRRVRVELTPGGAKLFEALFPRHVDRVVKLMPKLDSGTLRTLKGIADRKDSSRRK